MKQNKYAFTLVELIVVITIIAILGTIAFITMQGYSASSRDSVRISDMSKISSSLELFNIDAGKYPDPTEAQPITFTGGLAWYQGIFGDATFTNVSRLDKIPTDPLTEKEYAYSVLNTKQEFELGSIIEGDGFAYGPHPNPLPKGEGIASIFSKTNAFEKTAKAKITGTYNGVSLRVNANNTSYVLAIPSIITSIDLAIEANRGLEVIIPANEMVLDNYSNLPSNYVGTSYDSNKETTNPDFKIVNNILLYEGDIKNLTPTTLITKLQEAYSGTTVALTDATAELFQINVTSGLELERIDNYGKNFINNNLGGSAESRIYNTCEGVAHNTMKSYYSAPSVLFGISCDTVKKDFICIDGTWTDTPTGANILDYPETECVVEDALNCTYLETPINHGDSIDVYSESTIAWNATYDCPNRIGIVTCNNGVNEGATTFAYKTCTKGTPTNCTADSSYDLNGHTYNVIQMNHDVSSTPTVDISENNGIFRYTFNALCNDGTITGNETGPVKISCNTNYTWNDLTNECEADTKTYTCSAKPANTVWNTVGSYTQTWNGTDWLPEDTTISYNETSTTTSCNYKCDTGYFWNGSICEQQWSGTITTGYLFKNTSGVIQYPLSCNDLLDNSIFQNTLTGSPWNGTKFNDGVYWIKPITTSAYKAYCNMTTDGGGWTMVLSQYEADPVINWNEGIQGDYDPTLVTKKGFTLNTSQLPEHNQIGLGKDLDSTYVDYVNGIYSTGDLPTTLLKSPKTNYGYHIHRNTSNHYAGHDPENTLGNDVIWNNTLTIDKTGGMLFTWAFSPNQTSSIARGYSINSVYTPGTAETYAWTIWVRKSSGTFLVGNNGGFHWNNGTYASSCKGYIDNINYKNEGNGVYWVKPDTNPAFKVYCDMVTDGGGWTLAGNSKEVDVNGVTILNDNALGDITDINTVSTAKLSTNNINSILFGGERKIRIDNFDNNKYIIEYSANQTISFTQYKSYNLRLTHNGKTSIFYDSHPHFILSAGISSDTFVSSLCPSGCRQTFGMEYTDGIAGDYGWQPNLRRSGGVNPAPVSQNFYNYKLWLK